MAMTEYGGRPHKREAESIASNIMFAGGDTPAVSFIADAVQVAFSESYGICYAYPQDKSGKVIGMKLHLRLKQSRIRKPLLKAVAEEIAAKWSEK